MNYRWSKNDRRMMQEVIDYFKVMLEVRSIKRFIELADSRECPFCNATFTCSECRIQKCIGGRCTYVLESWNEFYEAWDSATCSLPELKSLLRDAIKELEPWGEK